ncbi:LIM and SH3 domain protein Lasp [Drosophila albomicans]|uniref:LIM and SH3 domain protein Lasp n=1 Tax=Drosophila albomicans TaxID=7291 RepID=A0A6P8WWV8_DROAB|nr:LIM and SH3 domain protein Lasp [Drosophila albomicans]
MFFSLAQTLVCVLLINGGLYALHLSGNGEKQTSPGPGSNGGQLSAAGAWQQQQQHQQQQQQQQHQKQLQQQQLQQQHQHAGGGAPPGGGPGSNNHGHRSDAHRSAAAAAFEATTGRLNKEIADMAQLERERLMLLGLAKQTAESPVAPAGHHGRPIIAGRIQMQPSEDLDVGDYPALLQQAARGFMFGSVQKQPPPPMAADEDYEELREFGRRPVKYDYGRVVQPTERELEGEAQYEPLHGFGDFDDFSELESIAEEPHVGEEELLRELDAYQYHGLEEEPLALPENPYRTLEQLEHAAPESLQQLFEQQEQHDAPLKANSKSHANGNYNIRMQQKWARKRAQGQAVKPQQQQQQQPNLQRNIFGQHFKQQRGKLALANSEATASKHLKASTRSGSSSSGKIAGKIDNGDDNAVAGSQQQNKPTHDKPASAEATATDDAQQQQQQQHQQEQNKKESDQQLMHPNHKRSGSSAGGSLGGFTSPQVSHSIASQLMLRTPRGQRQYDVPQIECPTAMDGMERFACPTPDLQGRYRCIDDHVLCDGFIDCPEGEDEDRRSCMFYKTTKAHLDVLADALLRWARGR